MKRKSAERESIECRENEIRVGWEFKMKGEGKECEKSKAARRASFEKRSRRRSKCLGRDREELKLQIFNELL